jgi:Tol biopolymer transport system component
MNADGSNQHLLVADSNFDDQRPSFTPDGSAVVFSRRRLDIEAYAIYQIGLAGGSPTAITSFELGIQDNSPKYSASGRLIFTSLGRRGIICAIYLKSRDGEGARQLTPAPLTFRRPDWSPDGNQIAASSHYGTPQNEEIWIFDRDGDRLRQLTNNGNDYFNGPHDINPSWSPQGDAIVFERDAPDFSSSGIFIMNYDGTKCRKLVALQPSPRANLLKQRETQRPVNARGSRNLVEIETGVAHYRSGA